MEEIKKIQKQIEEKYINKKDINENDLKDIEDILTQDNTNPKIIFSFLKLILKFKNETLKEQLKKFEFYINKDDFNKEFGKYHTKIYSSSEKFQLMINQIMKFSLS